VVIAHHRRASDGTGTTVVGTTVGGAVVGGGTVGLVTTAGGVVGESTMHSDRSGGRT
jgi:hypothetical protein